MIGGGDVGSTEAEGIGNGGLDTGVFDTEGFTTADATSGDETSGAGAGADVCSEGVVKRREG